MAAVRLFVAIVPPGTVRAELFALGETLAGVQAIPPENLHLTLRFIGETTPEAELAFIDALAGVHVESFVIPVDGTGIFPNHGPAKVLWTGVGRGHTRLFQLRKQVDEALLSVDPTIDVRNFHPHFTIGRLRTGYDARALALYLKRFAQFEAPPFRVNGFHMMASELRPGQAPLYRVVRTFALEK